MESKVWFITGASSGFGRGVLERILDNGHRAVAMARNTGPLDALAKRHVDRLLVLTADVRVTADVEAAVAKAEQRFGRIDILLNNAGHGLFGGIEEVTEADLQNVFETNVFGAMRLVRAVLPVMRAQGSGHIINISSAVGHASWPFGGAYAATKHAIEALSEALQAEVAPLGIRVTVINPGYFGTGFAGSMPMAMANPAYQAMRDQVLSGFGAMAAGNPDKVVDAILDAARDAGAPFRHFVGDDGKAWARESLSARLQAVGA
ncbi:MAG: SDR family oxidoreductase [Phenylobacterium sp.]|uniref:SDR family oxidoreductase n=1 Tax=Phenylobacterium sp. TaxID=1871053 RepID=UPI0025F4F0F5|nr:SDR family oxidoreductase [Phenylobacterium sp.]MCA6232005.1 SDR family oxidoreductase [Phenylobacterium sp.]MCA6235073.1 SDR family oxidoreductase [Phenylobacterium sp.]MCA6251160.1 SDR family oxidoreductase [Phenylobacterium sp.]MCA6256722.1 SDR family oxidoreductase [Phenylobacterium sp.]MCA6264560.1 SDR family oxidoreductase [Phenylobacterium sp.]